MATPLQPGRMMVSVVYAAKNAGFEKRVMAPRGQTLGWCVNASGIYGLYPELKDAAIGVWGKRAAWDALVEDGDRIEVYAGCDPDAVARARKSRKSIASAGE